MSNSGSSALSKADRRRTYERIIRITEKNTNNTVQPPLASKRSILTTAGHAGIDGETAQNAIRAAIENDDLLAVERSGGVFLAPVESDTLRAVIEQVALREVPTDKALVAECNRLLGTVE